MFEDLAHFVIRAELVGVDPDALPHQEREVADLLYYTLLATPAEGLAGRFVRIDRKLYGEIEGVTRQPI